MTHIVTHVDGAVGVITIDRKERFNSLDVDTARDLRKAGLAFARDANVRAVVLRGAHGIFCSGADLKYIWAAEASYGDTFQQILEYIHSTISEIRRAPKPFIAAVDGVAAAGGFGLAMSCDLVVASERAWFEWAYAKTGLTGAESSTFMLPRLIGLRRAMELLFLNPRLDAHRALDYGLITAVSPIETFDDDVMAMARKLSEGPTEALGIAKDLINQASGMDRLDYHLDRELDQLARIANGKNVAEGLSAFFEKRAPQFT
ncbi:MAG TPA: enoyl-CoA hydratase-related protein [Thermoanaerobaculia bacterium]|nr:enoyl-CoA hydratase-related protein [Thermoanaerobaculia bacterium]